MEIEVIALDRPRLATDIMMTITDMKVQINAIHARAVRQNLATVNLKIEIRNLSHLNNIMEKIKKIKDVIEVHRVIPNK